MLDLLESLEAWPLLIVALAVFGFLPGVVLRFIVLAYRRDDPRRAEILAERHAVPRWEDLSGLLIKRKTPCSRAFWKGSHRDGRPTG